MSADQNIQLVQTLDDAWNAQDWDTFDQRHKTDTIVRWPGRPPTHGRKAHRAEGVQLFQTFPDNRVGNRPYKTLFASGDWTCSIARFTGTMTGPMVLADGTEIPPTGKSFEVDFCTVARLGQRPDRRGEPLLRPRRDDVPARAQRMTQDHSKGVRAMDGSSTALIVIPIVTTISLALWLAVVYWAYASSENG